MSTSLGIRDYSDYNYRQYEVTEGKDAPRTSHFAACIFDTVNCDSSWSVAEGGGSYQKPIVRYYAFPSKDVLEQWVGEASRSKKTFFIFAAKMAEAQVQVRVEVGVTL